MRRIQLLLFLIIALSTHGQVVPTNGVKESKPVYYAIKNATVYVSPGNKIPRATILIKGDKIEKVGPFVSVPNNAVEIDMKGMTIFPAFIELNTSVGVPSAQKRATNSPQLESAKDGAYYWNEAIHPEVDATALFDAKDSAAKLLIQKGFGFAMTRQNDGIAQGSGAFVSLGSSKNYLLKNGTSTGFFSFKKGISNQTYPSSQMGAIALLRQCFYDANWYREAPQVQNLSLDALNRQRANPLFFEIDDKLELLRAQKIAEEFKLKFNYLGAGNEYESINEIAALKRPVVLPLNFPEAYDVKDPYIARQIPLSALKHWELAPRNPAILAAHGVPICLSGNEVKKPAEFWENLRKAIQNGLSEKDALAALTVTPAQLIGFDSIVGTLAHGKLASFFIYDGNPLKEKATLLQSWHMGKQTVHDVTPEHNIIGKYTIQVDGYKFPLKIESDEDDDSKYTSTVTQTTVNKKGEKTHTDEKAKVSLQGNDVTIQFNANSDGLKGNVSLKGKVSSLLGVFEGDGLLPNGKWVKWSAIKTGVIIQHSDADKLAKADTTMRSWSPNMAYGFDTIPTQKSLVIRNATLWTNEAEGILKDATVIVVDGKITFVGNGNHRVPPGAKIIDAKGKHVTSGIIDEHSHVAISKGVNESGQASSAEVSIGDVVNPHDINIYRQLSGGVTASQLLHGSANPIGGQSALVKLKWGVSADEMLIDNAPKFIKFALGENVKQTNWGDDNVVRFPQTRMGVEQMFYDGFYRARQYGEDKAAGKKIPTDLELEVLYEILEKKRFITCHSYIQSEINMLMHVADSMGFTLNTFTHILEGYKVADKMAAHGAGGSTFSDWWAYKYEVNDAIPYNAKLMADQGVVVAINSDDAEMGRRLNQEAAKAVKYGGMAPEEAWKMVTLNPAKLLHLDDRMGSLKVGKDADIVIWSENPLSITAKVEKTVIDGVVYYDKSRDAYMRKKNAEEKARIINKMALDNESGGKKKPFFSLKKGLYHCDTIGEEASHESNEH